MPYDPEEQHQMFGALATLPHLASLTLPSSRALEHIGALADRPLRRLQVWEDYRDTSSNHLTANALNGISRLRQLTHLHFERCLVGEPVRSGRGVDCNSLLHVLPPSVELLTIRFEDHHNVTFQIRDGILIVVHITDFLQPAALGQLARALLASNKMGPRLGLLRLEHVDTTKGDAPGLDPWDEEALCGLVRRCSCVEVGTLHAVSADAALQAADLLGVPEQLLLGAPPGHQRIDLLRPRPAGVLAGGGDSIGGSGGRARSAAEVAAGVLRSLAAPHGGPAGRLLLLTGPFVSVLSVLPEPLHSWMACIRRSAAAVTAASTGLGNGRALAAYQVLPPPAAALALECGWHTEAAATVAAAVRSVTRSTIPGALEVVPVRAGVVDFAYAYGLGLGQALQAVWDEGAGGGSARERLQHLLSLWRELGQLPPKSELL
ncbi:hypothetical protein GPECTOR_11g127 [Gonium pectorale]|uniref:Uncharacterized protein n=1 Tax=Gonium pectorale TaxID=33097 RepID=A0A150GPF3_GONPE|nr:hypothetical protein GPECTOR_11g127 [Gonium pectorale]|eukprot:KXZ51675.1 hypothetical protein GPECTOR_11g127 [Gonium pectorale]